MTFTNAQMMATVAAMVVLGVLQPVVESTGGRWSFKDAFNDTIDHVTNYAFLADKVAYTSSADFDPNGDTMRTIELSQGQSLKYACGDPDNDNDGTFTVVPSDPMNYVLDYKGNDNMTIALKRVRPAYSVYRSDNKIIIGAFQKIGFDHLLITYGKDTIIAADDPENFSINLVCMFQSHDPNQEVRYRWLQIKFKGVVSLPYGCGSAMFHMFKNTIPMDPRTLTDNNNPLRFCSIKAEPGMVVGIYCDKDDTVYPHDCFVQTQSLGSEAIGRSGLLDSTFPHNSMDGRLRLARVRDNVDGYNTGAVCYCRDKNNTITASVKMLFNKPQICDYEKFMTVMLRDRRVPHYKCHKEISAGSVVTLVIPKPGNSSDSSRLAGRRGIYPVNPTVNTLVVGNSTSGFKKKKIEDLVGSVGLYISQKDDGKNNIYEFKTSLSTVLVLRTPVANLTYLYEFYDSFNHSLMSRKTVITLAITPTDPYTYGCGVGPSNIFNTDGINFDNKNVRTGSGVHTEVNCMVNGYATSPVGFYCPENHILYPEDCFTRAILVSTGQTVLVSDYAPLARTVKSKAIRVLDFSLPAHAATDLTYSEEKLQCLCRRKDGIVMAAITLDLRDPSTRR